MRSPKAGATPGSPLQVFQTIKTRWVDTVGRLGDGWDDTFMVLQSGTKSNTVMSEERHRSLLRHCSYNAMVLPSETRDNASKTSILEAETT